MANMSDVMVRVGVEQQGRKVENVDFHEEKWAEFVALFTKASYCGEGAFMGDADFNVTGGWSFTYGIDGNLTRAYMKWLEGQGYSGITLEYVETECGSTFIGMGRIHGVFFDGNVQLTMKNRTWGLEEYLKEKDLLTEDLGNYIDMAGAAMEDAWENFDELDAAIEDEAESHMEMSLLPAVQPAY